MSNDVQVVDIDTEKHFRKSIELWDSLDLSMFDAQFTL